jgi:hypothetical protein
LPSSNQCICFGVDSHEDVLQPNNLHLATMTPIMVMPGAVTAYTVSPWNNIQACRPKKDDKNSSLADGVSHSNSNANSTFEQRCRAKCNPAILLSRRRQNWGVLSQ